MISPLCIDFGQFIFGWHFRNFLGDERPFSLDIEGYRSRIRPEAILQRLLSTLSTDLGGFIPGQFLADSDATHHRFRAIYRICHFLSIIEATDHGIRSRLFSTDNEVY
ncbi:unnamed protein product [Linum trigynum]|uniref:Uncharacterized protein n=1 Tax=Linum trigynum TaxID=586398 RepID=A0AAV2EG98_9ROSI